MCEMHTLPLVALLVGQAIAALLLLKLLLALTNLRSVLAQWRFSSVQQAVIDGAIAELRTTCSVMDGVRPQPIRPADSPSPLERRC